MAVVAAATGRRVATVKGLQGQHVDIAPRHTGVLVGSV